MHNRFAPGLPKLRRVLDYLKSTIEHTVASSDQLWIEAFSTVIGSDSKSISVDDVRTTLLTIMTTGEEVPWEFYDIVSELIKHLPLATKESITKNIKIETGYEYEFLQVTTDGHWQIVWEVDPADDAEYREVALDWYVPPDQEKAPIVPLTIIDCIASCVLLLRKNLVLPAISVLSIAFEATLWDALVAKGIPRSNERIFFTAVRWHLRRVNDKLLVTVEGADRNVKELDTLVEPFTEFSIELRRTQMENSENKVELLFGVDKDLVAFLASDHIQSREPKTDRGLSAAIQRARNPGVDCLRTVPRAYDATLISLRNNLIHLPARGTLDQPIPLPGRGQLLTVDDLRTRQPFVNQLLYLVVGVIRNVYIG